MISGILQFEFLQNAFLTGIIIGAIAPLVGVFVVVRRMSMISDALSHVALAGIAFSLLLQKSFLSLAGLNPLYIGMAFSVGGSLFIEKLRGVYKHYQELAIPIIMSGGMGLSVIFISIADGFNTDLYGYLFGSVSAVSRADLYVILAVGLVVALMLTLLYKELFLLSFDEEHAKASGIPYKAIHFIFIVMVALVIAASMKIIGILLVSSLMTLPVAASLRFAKGFKQMIGYSVLFGEVSVIGGLFLSYNLDLAPGGTIVIIAVLILILSILFDKWKNR
ncbi:MULTISPECIES: metal ABC transporter permease [Bacillaceae]|jgi:zinc transport system permease protein|uniref:High-affinity zinc uptake system membrane protein ZnuB n=2 Tax=Peribacillus TaxID=2675229 RepID=A0A9W4L125_9BACI|nr:MULTISPECIES: metal ABC transporter permease [Bacillaceae]KRF49736.1 metal ABC transporter permease [Bacillus sp. Soil745]MBD8135044.1 metal ABC transporter permease [Bacillus sp. CFBP 13597]MBT2602450.1 metal ABC transporter permease [Bacillus sp. ISL-53]MCD1161257.1 metal ABC transporter permease [Peribacillus castrilensis]MCP1092642.1 metal ABC transporter permease [Bacillaceae bacterium OS4b]MDP9740102.1 zinc transport system permease protein [Bacillus sp. B2I3]PEF41177.1 metal ABC tr